MIVKICPCCGEHFAGESDYCSTKCREEYMGLRKKAQVIKARAPRKPKIESDLARLNDEARKAGMNYGEYSAKLRDAENQPKYEKHKEELRKRLRKNI